MKALPKSGTYCMVDRSALKVLSSMFGYNTQSQADASRSKFELVNACERANNMRYLYWR
jgi:hypothetical protein